jgi:hypothetical protein
MTEEEEKKLAHFEKRLVPNVDFDDQALYILGFGTDIYYMLGYLGWVQFSNGVSANNHKEFVLEILMTMAPSLDGVSTLSFRLEGIQQVVPYEYIRELLGFQKSPGTSGRAERHVGRFLEYDHGRSPPTKEYLLNPIIQVFHSWTCKRILGRMRETKVTDTE